MMVTVPLLCPRAEQPFLTESKLLAAALAAAMAKGSLQDPTCVRLCLGPGALQGAFLSEGAVQFLVTLKLLRMQ